jgi:hypothetical protein
VRVLQRPLVLVSGLTFGDFLLWHWSLNAGHDILALVSGVTLVPLLLLVVLMAAKTVMRALVIRTPRRAGAAQATERQRSEAAGRSGSPHRAPAEANGDGTPARAASAAERQQNSSRLAA